MAIRSADSVRKVIDVVGRDRVMAITRTRSPNVSNWIACDRFPPQTYVVMSLELRRLRCRAPLKLWGMIEPSKVVRAA